MRRKWAGWGYVVYNSDSGEGCGEGTLNERCQNARPDLYSTLNRQFRSGISDETLAHLEQLVFSTVQ
ncbi:MAG: hypothetical protein Q8K51_06200 [Nitrospirota bacterium]|nr:hypothetical protein [Nitrospirota bacterium]